MYIIIKNHKSALTYSNKSSSSSSNSSSVLVDFAYFAFLSSYSRLFPASNYCSAIWAFSSSEFPLKESIFISSVGVFSLLNLSYSLSYAAIFSLCKRSLSSSIFSYSYKSFASFSRSSIICWDLASWFSN